MAVVIALTCELNKIGAVALLLGLAAEIIDALPLENDPENEPVQPVDGYPISVQVPETVKLSPLNEPE